LPCFPSREVVCCETREVLNATSSSARPH
jgi:hypothetical protein